MSGKYKKQQSVEESLQSQIDRNFLIATTALVLALSTGIGLGVGFGVGFGNRINDAENALRATQLRTNNVEMQLLELVMNTSSVAPVYTTRLSGTFDYAVQSNAETVISGSTYRLRDVTIGPLNFTILELGAPTTPYVFPASFVTAYRFKLRNFVPPLQPTPLFLEDTSQGYPVTQANLNRVSITGGCFVSATCTLSPDVGDGIIPNAILFRNPGLTPVTNEIQFYIGPTATVVGQTFTLSSPWMFLIPSF